MYFYATFNSLVLILCKVLFTNSDACAVYEDQLDINDKADIVSMINELRNKVALGRGPYDLDPAGGMSEMEWHEDIAKFAVSGINRQTCAFRNCTRGCPVAGYSNCYASEASYMYPEGEKNMRTFLMQWIKGPETEMEPAESGIVTYHFLQMLAENTTNVGCAYMRHDTIYYGQYTYKLSCIFCPGLRMTSMFNLQNPAIQLKNIGVYQMGEYCSNCIPRTACSNDRRYMGLCKPNSPKFPTDPGWTFGIISTRSTTLGRDAQLQASHKPSSASDNKPMQKSLMCLPVLLLCYLDRSSLKLNIQ